MVSPFLLLKNGPSKIGLFFSLLRITIVEFILREARGQF